METSALLFSLCLLLAGVWLIFTINSDLKKKRRQVPQVPETPRRNPHVAHRVANVVQRETGNSARHRPSPLPINASNGVAANSNKADAIDQWQTLNTAFLRETFEKFTRD